MLKGRLLDRDTYIEIQKNASAERNNQISNKKFAIEHNKTKEDEKPIGWKLKEVIEPQELNDIIIEMARKSLSEGRGLGSIADVDGGNVFNIGEKALEGLKDEDIFIDMKAALKQRTADIKVERDRPFVEADESVNTSEYNTGSEKNELLSPTTGRAEKTGKGILVEILNRTFDNISPSKIESMWDALVNHRIVPKGVSDEDKETLLEVTEIKPNLSPSIRQLFVSMGRYMKLDSYKKVKGTKLQSRVENRIYMRFNSQGAERTYKVLPSGTIIINLPNIKKLWKEGDDLQQTHNVITKWLSNNGHGEYKDEDSRDLMWELYKYALDSISMKSARPLLPSETNDEKYQDLLDVIPDIRRYVTNKVKIGAYQNKDEIKEVANQIAMNFDKEYFNLSDLGFLISKRPDINDKEIQGKVEKELDVIIDNRPLSYYILKAVVAKVGYKAFMDKAENIKPEVIQDLRNFKDNQKDNRKGRSDEPPKEFLDSLKDKPTKDKKKLLDQWYLDNPNPNMKKSVDSLDEDERRRVKTILQNAHPTEYFGEDYLKLGKLINILDEVEGNEGELSDLDEENLKMVKLAASLRKRYENLYRNLRDIVYPEGEEE